MILRLRVALTMFRDFGHPRSLARCNSQGFRSRPAIGHERNPETLRVKFRSALLLPTILLAAGLASPVDAAAVKFRTTGSYTDGAGTQHRWSINDAHALIWDNQPYVPVGAVLRAQSLAPTPTDEAFKADTAALDTLKGKGITDIVLRSSAPFTSCDPAALQKLIDYLHQNGFTYGIEIGDGPTEPLVGYVVAPNKYRQEGPSAESVFAWNWPDVDSAICVVVNRLTVDVESTGGAAVKNGRVTVALPEPLTSNQVLTVYPRKTVRSADGQVIGDVWSGFGEYRDRLLDFFKKVKFGPGLRFFLEPFTCKVDPVGDEANLVPDSAKFRLGFEAYLTRKYVHEGSVNAAWALNDTLDSIQTAARLVPLWGSGRGISYAYDRAGGQRYPVDTSASSIWRDINDYRDTSAQEYMNTIADTLKKQVANVPVVFKGSRYHRIYSNPYGIGGFDGLGAQAFGLGEGLATQSAGPIYALAEGSGKSTWFITTTRPFDKLRTEPQSGGYANETAMSGALDVLREVGCKGFFIDDPLVGPGSEIPAQQGQIDWLKAFKDRLAKTKIADAKPMVIEYPNSPVVGGYVKRLAPETWWLPTLRSGKVSYIGDGLGAYSIAGEDRTYLWSGVGPKTLTFKAGPTGLPTVEFPANASIDKRKGGTFALTLKDVPTVLRGIDVSLAFPYETAQAEVSTLASMIPEADKAGANVQRARDGLDRAKRVLAKGQPLIAYGIAQTAIHEIAAVRGGEVWIEGESSPAHSYSGPVAMPGASGNLALVVDTAEDAPMSPYTAYYAFEAPINSSYELWIAGSAPTESSAASYNVDDAGWTTVAAEAGTIQDYAPGLAWHKIGGANLTPGRHTIKVQVDSRRSQDNRYYFALDVIVFSPRSFKPNGVTKPF